MRQRCGKNQGQPPRARHLIGAPPYFFRRSGGGCSGGRSITCCCCRCRCCCCCRCHSSACCGCRSSCCCSKSSSSGAPPHRMVCLSSPCRTVSVAGRAGGEGQWVLASQVLGTRRAQLGGSMSVARRSTASAAAHQGHSCTGTPGGSQRTVAWRCWLRTALLGTPEGRLRTPEAAAGGTRQSIEARSGLAEVPPRMRGCPAHLLAAASQCLPAPASRCWPASAASCQQRAPGPSPLPPAAPQGRRAQLRRATPRWGQGRRP